MTTVEITKEVQTILSKCKFQEQTAFDRQYILTALLPNGFVVTETTTYVSPEEFNDAEAKQATMLKIMDKITDYVTFTNAN